MSTGFDTSFSVTIVKLLGKTIFNNFFKSENINILDKKFDNAIYTVSIVMQKKYPRVLGGDIDVFFGQSEIKEELAKLLFRRQTININSIELNFDTSTLPDGFINEFTKELRDELRKYHEFERILSDTSLYRRIEENMSKTTQEKNFNFDEFYLNYKRAIIRNFTKVNYIGLGLSPNVMRGEKNINDIYILPRFLLKKEEVQKDIYSPSISSDVINLKKLLSSQSENVVIIGNPGAGKSILGKYIVCSIINKNIHAIPNNFLEKIPFRIELRKYLPYKRKNDVSLIDFILHTVKNDFYITLFNKENLIYILNSMESLIVFDGLDEIFNVQDKIEIKNDIENFVGNFENTKAIVTSRLIGYDEAKLDTKTFVEVEILDFNGQQINEYVNKWYACEVKVDERIEKEIEYFLNNINDIDGELKNNPLLLSLIVILFRNNGKLPHSKLEIYRSCTRTLVDKWDEMKNLTIDMKVSNKKENIFSYLALWQYESLSNATTDITYNEVSKQVELIIREKLKLTEDIIESKKWAEEFLEYAKNRSLYFDNDFTHKTFMEYFTAYCIYQKTDLKMKPDERNKIFKLQISNSFWFIVLELLVNLIDENQVDNEIIDDLIIQQINNDKDAYIFFLHILNTLNNVSDNLIKKLIKDALTILINEVSFDGYNNLFVNELFKKISNLLYVDRFAKIIQQCYDEIFETINDNYLLTSYIIFGLDINIIRRKHVININHELPINELRFQNDYLFRRTVGKNTIDELLLFKGLFGQENVFKSYRIPFLEHSRYTPLIDHFLYNYLRNFNEKLFEKDIVILNTNGFDLGEIGKHLDKRPKRKDHKQNSVRMFDIIKTVKQLNLTL